MHTRDLTLLLQLKLYFGVGNVRTNKDGTSVYAVASLKDLTDVIIPHFLDYPLQSKKRADFLLFKEILEFMSCREHLSNEGLRKIVSIRASLNYGLSDELKKVFPHIIPILRPLVENVELRPYWLAGFLKGEGCFHVKMTKSETTRTGIAVQLQFKLS
jgi:hypothetical protein